MTLSNCVKMTQISAWEEVVGQNDPKIRKVYL